MNNIRREKHVLLILSLFCLFTISTAILYGRAQVGTGSWRFTIQANDVYNPDRSISFSADNNYLVVGYEDKVYFFNKSNPTPLWTNTIEGWANSIAVSENGSRIVVANDLEKIYLFKLNGSEIWQYEVPSAVSHLKVSISYDGKHIVAGGDNDILYLFNDTSSTPMRNYNIGADILALQISANSEYIALGASDMKLYVFNRSSLEQLYNYSATGLITDIAISVNGTHIVMGSLDQTIYFFDTVTPTPLWMNITNGFVQSVDISDDGEYIVANGGSKLYLFNQSSANPLWTYETYNDVEDVAISGDGNYIILGMQDASLANKLMLFNDSSSISNPSPIETISQSEEIDEVDITSNGDYFAVKLPHSITLYDRTDLSIPVPAPPPVIGFDIIPGFAFSILLVAFIYFKIKKSKLKSE